MFCPCFRILSSGYTWSKQWAAESLTQGQITPRKEGAGVGTSDEVLVVFPLKTTTRQLSWIENTFNLFPINADQCSIVWIGKGHTVEEWLVPLPYTKHTWFKPMELSRLSVNRCLFPYVSLPWHTLAPSRVYLTSIQWLLSVAPAPCVPWPWKG